jgi:hypothetical protein
LLLPQNEAVTSPGAATRCRRCRHAKEAVPVNGDPTCLECFLELHELHPFGAAHELRLNAVLEQRRLAAISHWERAHRDGHVITLQGAVSGPWRIGGLVDGDPSASVDD